MKHDTQATAGLLQQIADIQRMEPGKLCVMRQSETGAYYNLQCREGGKSVSRYVPQDQVEAVQQNTENYLKFQTLVETYAQTVIDRTREERQGAQKKRPKPSSGFRTKRSSS